MNIQPGPEKQYFYVKQSVMLQNVRDVLSLVFCVTRYVL